jgi:Na+(H+)/acetate symporter ActP
VVLMMDSIVVGGFSSTTWVSPASYLSIKCCSFITHPVILPQICGNAFRMDIVRAREGVQVEV